MKGSVDNTQAARWLDEVKSANRHLSADAARLALAVHIARCAGATWDKVGGTLGVSRQAAQQRFGS